MQQSRFGCIRSHPEQTAHKADKVINACTGEVRISGGLGEDDPPLKDRLRVAGKTRGSPVSVDVALFARRFDVGLRIIRRVVRPCWQRVHWLYRPGNSLPPRPARPSS